MGRSRCSVTCPKCGGNEIVWCDWTKWEVRCDRCGNVPQYTSWTIPNILRRVERGEAGMKGAEYLQDEIYGLREKVLMLEAKCEWQKELRLREKEGM